jgi:hypothetical protein
VSSSPLVRRFEAIEIGYKTKLAVVVALAYIIGLTMMTVTQAGNDIVMEQIMRLLRRIQGKQSTTPFTSLTSPFAYSYWRRVAGTYVGANLSPDTAAASSHELDKFIEYSASITGQVPPDALADLISNQERGVEHLDKAATSYRETVAKATRVNAPQVNTLLERANQEISEASDLLKHEREKLDALHTVENKLRAL